MRVNNPSIPLIDPVDDLVNIANALPTKHVSTVLLLILACLFAYRIWLITQPWVGLYHDEAYYYHWSLIPDFGYYSKPPMIAWIIGLSSSLAGATSFGIKLGPAICWFLSSLTISRIAMDLWGSRTGWLAGLIFFTTPLAGFYSVFATTDAALLLFWSLSLLGFLRAQTAHQNTDDPLAWWLMAGLATGFGLLSKYTMFALPLAYLLFIVATPERRRQLKTLGPWLAGLVALALFSLNVVWNVDNDFVAWRHTSEIAKLDNGPLINPMSLLAFWGEQAGIFGLLGSGILLLKWKELRTALKASPQLQMIVLASAVLFAVISTQALLSRAFANWAAPIIIGLSFLLTALFKEHPRKVAATIILNLILLTGFYHIPQLLAVADIEPTKRNNPWLRVDPWAEHLVSTGLIPDDLASLPLASDSRAILANLSVALHPTAFPSRYWDNESGRVADYYDQRINFADWPGQGSWLFATDHLLTPTQEQSFRSARLATSIDGYYPWRPEKTLYLYRVEDFRGYR